MPDGTADVSAELVALESGLRLGARGVEEVTRVHRVVAEIIVHFAMKFIRTGARGDIYDRAGVAAILGTVRGVVDLEFGDGVDRGLECDLILHHIVQVDAVDHEVDGVFAAAGGVKCERSLTAKRRREEPVGWWSHRAGNE